ncbi:hypothetical protein GBAR_LOCUS4537 [Geodia barretti]|uniref:Uncharacterized protein n=1 Tax=Geodia barretti TaxID=519541 RepID=A0AA35W2U0_GEOBA|nr:hypothetical protein GBAR_LOCUS4537 [Geodia barretti]
MLLHLTRVSSALSMTNLLRNVIHSMWDLFHKKISKQ